MTSQFASIGKQETTLSAGPKKLLDSAKHSDMPYFLRDENMQKCALPMPKYDDGGFFSTNLGNENHLDFQTFIQHEAKLLEEKEQNNKSALNTMDGREKLLDTRTRYETTKNQSTLEKKHDNPVIETELNEMANTQPTISQRAKENENTSSINKSDVKQIKEKRTFSNLNQSNKYPLTAASKMSRRMNTNNELEQFLASINKEPVKKSVKDFDYLKYLNQTILKDDILGQFMEHASEFEKAAGKQAQSQSPSKRKGSTSETPVEMIRAEFGKNPHRFYTVTRFDQFVSRMKKQMANKGKEDDQKDRTKSPEKKRLITDMRDNEDKSCSPRKAVKSNMKRSQNASTARNNSKLKEMVSARRKNETATLNDRLNSNRGMRQSQESKRDSIK